MDYERPGGRQVARLPGLLVWHESLREVGAPFGLPEVWDVAKVVGADSHFAKYDIRDGFWHCEVNEGSRHRLVLRHATAISSGRRGCLSATSTRRVYSVASPRQWRRLSEGVQLLRAWASTCSSSSMTIWWWATTRSSHDWARRRDSRAGFSLSLI